MAERGWGYVDWQQVDELSAITTLDRAISLTPDSELFQTPACRAVIVPQHGYLIDSGYTGRLPLTIDVATKVAKYAGARTGVWKSEAAFDATPNNQITRFRDINDTYMSETMYDQYWDIGVIWAQNVNRTTAFYPTFGTVYSDDTSVLRSMVYIMAVCQIWKYAVFGWQAVVGNQKLTKEQLISRSNEVIIDNISGKFDDRFDIGVDTFLTKADEVRGYSWSCNITVKSNVMPTVGTYTIYAERRDGTAPSGSTSS